MPRINTKLKEYEYKNRNRNMPKTLYDRLKRKRKCQDCKKKFTSPLELHHKKPVSQGGKSRANNLVTLCKNCHERRHKEKEIRRKRKK